MTKLELQLEITKQTKRVIFCCAALTNCYTVSAYIFDIQQDKQTASRSYVTDNASYKNWQFFSSLSFVIRFNLPQSYNQRCLVLVYYYSFGVFLP